MRGLPLLAVLGVALAGCLSEQAAPMPPESPAGQEPEETPWHGFATEGCVGLVFVAEVPGAWVDPLLAEGYDAGAEANPHLHAHRCASVVVGNATYRDVQWAESGVLLTLANGLEAAGANHYVFEMLLDVEAAPLLARLLAEDGWPVVDAQVTLSADRIAVAGGGIAYDASVVGEPDAEPYPDDSARFHHGGAEPLYMDYDGMEGTQVTVWPTLLTAEGGAWGAIAQGSGALAGVTQQDFSDGRYGLHRAGDAE